MTLLTLAFAVTAFSASRLLDSGLLTRWPTGSLLPGLVAILCLIIAALQGLTGEYSVRLADGTEPDGLLSHSEDERRRATAEAHHCAAFTADWSAEKKLSEALQARAWLTRGIVALLLAGFVAACIFVTVPKPLTHLPEERSSTGSTASP